MSEPEDPVKIVMASQLADLKELSEKLGMSEEDLFKAHTLYFTQMMSRGIATISQYMNKQTELMQKMAPQSPIIKPH